MKECKGKVYVVFEDFDSADRKKMYVLQKCCLHVKMMNMIQSMVPCVSLCVYILACAQREGGFSECFDCSIGLNQGCILSPILFLLFINALAYMSRSRVHQVIP